MLRQNAARFGIRAALKSEGAAPALSYGELWNRVEAVVANLNHLGLGRGDTVALVLPQGGDLAVAFLAVAAGAKAAPLNPGYAEKDFSFYLKDLNASALILAQDSNSPARAAAAGLGVPIIELVPVPGKVGEFTLYGMPKRLDSGGGFQQAGDVGLVLHTSGTTSRPKTVPLSHSNLLAAAMQIGTTLELKPTDCCLNVMPLFHTHGLVGALLAPLAAGGSVVCPGQFDPNLFFGWLNEYKPTWYSGVPTMHRAILDRAVGQSVRPLQSSLRFIRSSSAALAPSLIAGLEEVFGVPVIDSYGMTEAPGQITSNPLPPRKRKPGSVGLAAGPEVAILNEAGDAQLPGQIGEVTIRGANLIDGYANNPDANNTAFRDGWFRTGDQGYLDSEGYLFITGRLKELIHRGGEKIAPREIDEALLGHPEVRHALAFAVPHPSLGENIAAAVVLRDGARCTEAALREFAFDRLPAFKVPSRIVFVADLPKGPTGKLQRIGLADRLAHALVSDYEPPANDTERLVADTVCAVLGRTRVGRNDDFFSLGGDSLRASAVLARIEQSLGLRIPVSVFFRFPTPAQLGAKLDEMAVGCEIDVLALELEKLSPEERFKLINEG